MIECVHCGYDLTPSTPDESGRVRCPECGIPDVPETPLSFVDYARVLWSMCWPACGMFLVFALCFVANWIRYRRPDGGLSGGYYAYAEISGFGGLIGVPAWPLYGLRRIRKQRRWTRRRKNAVVLFLSAVIINALVGAVVIALTIL